MLNSESGDGLGFLPRPGQPESALEPGMGAPARPVQELLPTPAISLPFDTSIGPVALEQPATWVYDFDPASGSSRATFNGEVTFTSGGGAAAGVASFNSRTGAVTLTAADVTGVGAIVNPSPNLSGVPLAPTATAGTSSTQIATTAFVAQAVANAPTVQSFNGRGGAVTLTAGDITGAGGAPSVSPALTGVPTAPTASAGNQSSQVATTQFVANAIAGGTVLSFNGRGGAVTLTLSDVMSVGGAPISSPNFTGTPAGPTASPGTATTQLATTAFVTNAITAGTAGVASWNGRSGAVTMTLSDITSIGGAPLLSPTFTGTPAAPTPTAGDSSTKLATTAFVATAISSLPVGVSTFNGRTGTVTLQLADVTSVGGAPLASPTFTGSPLGTTAPPGDNSTRLATTAYVTASFAPISSLPAPATVAPVMDGTAAVGVSVLYARQDHVHPTDTSRYAASNPSGYQTATQVTASLGAYLPLAGGTITGGLTVNGGGTYINTLNLKANSVGTLPILQMIDSSSNPVAQFYWSATAGVAYVTNQLLGSNIGLASDVNVTPVSGHNFLLNGGQGYEGGGGPWIALSDSRIKTVVGDYVHGLEEILGLRPIVYVYNGNDVMEGLAQSMHADAAKAKRRFVGLVAQDAEKVLPEIIGQVKGTIDGKPVEDLRTLDGGPLVYALINAVRALSGQIENLTARVAALEA